MRIDGLQKLTLLDFPGHTACTVFTGGCNFRCPFCHNASLVLHPDELPVLPEAELFRFLETRRGLLDGVAITGGEPTLQPDLPEFMEKVRELGYAVKLDTNGARPAVLREILNRGLADYVAMDIKSSREHYEQAAGVSGILDAVLESIDLLRFSGTAYEFRTTAVKNLHTEADFRAIGEWLRGTERYFIQSYTDSGDILAAGMEAFSNAELHGLLDIVKPFLPAAELRGVD